MPKPYNGHRSWNAWNVSLWIGNDESIYRLAVDCLNRAKRKDESEGISEGLKADLRERIIRRRATRYFLREVGETRTPDGGKFNFLSVFLALDGLT